jgi:O-antigen ligase
MVERSTETGEPPHNDYLRVYAEMGVIGLAAYLSFLAAFGLSALRGLRRTERGGFEWRVLNGVFACFVAFAAMSVVANMISQVVVMMYVAVLAGIAAAYGGDRRPHVTGPVGPPGP